MGACAGRQKRSNNESRSNRKHQKRGWRFSAIHNRPTEQRGLLNSKDDQNNAPSITTLYDLPLEMLDIILLKSFLHWIVNSSEKLRDEEVIRSLISVDVCFNRRITRQRFQKTIWRYLKDFYEKTKKISAIIRNNRNYLLTNIQANDEFIHSLLSFNCITEEQSHFIQRQRSTQDKNTELLRVVGYFDDTKFSTFVNILRQVNQTAVAKIVENGGVVAKIKVIYCGKACTASMDPQLLHQSISDLRSRTKPRSHQTDKLISQLKDEGIEILNSQLDRQTVVVWMWCRSQSALEYVQKLYESNQLKDLFVGFANYDPSTSEMIPSKVISIDRNQFKKTVVVCPISVNFTERIDVGRNEVVWGMANLLNEIYVLCRSYTPTPHVIRVFENQNPFRLQKKIEVKEIKSPADVGSSEKENCLYVSDTEEKCIWRITRETGDQHKIIKWLTTNYAPHTLSLSNDGHLLVVSASSSILMIYGPDAELLRYILFPGDIKEPIHAVETSIGNFIIVHRWIAEKNGNIRSIWREWDTTFVISELTRDGQMVIRRYISSNETQQLKDPRYLSLDSGDRVFVADYGNRRVLLLNSDLKWNQILCPTKEEKQEEEKIFERLCYDQAKKQLFVGGGFYGEVYVYMLSRK